MFSESDEVRLRHMLDAAHTALNLSIGRSRQDLDDAEDAFVHAVVRLITVICEAAGKVTESAKSQLPGIRWDEVIGMRIRLIHVYFDIDLDIVWATLRDDLPPLVQELEAALPPPAYD